MSYAIEIEGVSKRYRISHGRSKETFYALRDINLNIEEGSVMGFMGINGAGKSTLLKILSRITPPSTGRVKLHGRTSALLEVGSGFHQELTGRENIFLKGAILGMSRSEIKKEFDAIVDFAGVEKFLDTPVKRYSSGMFVRLAFSIAAHLRSDILLLDEVLAVGDGQFRQKSLNRMRQATQEEGRTVIYVSHQLHTIRELCDQAVLMEHGQITSRGKANAVVTQYLTTLSQRAETTPLAERKERRGTGEGRLTALNFVNPENPELPGTLRSGSPALLKVGFSLQRVEEISLEMNILNDRGDFITTLNSRLTGDVMQVEAGHHECYCRIQNFPLMKGDYSIRAHLFVDARPADIVEHAIDFEVQPGDFYGFGEYVNRPLRGVFIPQQWQQNHLP